MAYKTFVNGFPLNASELNTFLMNQSVATFADAAARTAAIATPAEGQLTYLNSDDSYYKYDGTAWVKITGMSNDLVPTSPNYIINGAFDIWQRGTSVTSGYGADRWILNLSGATGTFSRQAFTAGELEVAAFGGAEYFARVNTTVADDFTGIQQRVENVSTLAGQTVTISAWIRSSDATAFRLQLQQVFGSGGSATYTTPSSNITPTSDWQRYSVTVDLPSISGKTIGSGNYLALNINVPTSQTFTLDIWGVQVEAGSVATPFRRNANSIQGELAACQRYYYKAEATGGIHLSVGYAGSTTAARYAFPTPVLMRATPSLTSTNLRIGYGGFNINTPSSVTIFSSIGNTCEIRATASSAVLTAGGAIALYPDPSLGGSIELSAEL